MRQRLPYLYPILLTKLIPDPCRTLSHKFLVPRCGPAAFPILTL